MKYRYSLRSLMVGLTLFCVLLGSRIEYLRRWAVFHEREAASGKQKLAGGQSQFLHKMLASDYRRAMTRPWTVVDEFRDEPMTVRAEFSQLPLDDRSLKAWLVKTPGVETVHIHRDANRVNISMVVRGAPDFGDLPFQMELLGYKGMKSYDPDFQK